MATFAESRSRVRFRIGNKTGMDPIINQNINEAIRQIILRVRPKEFVIPTTFVTVAGQFKYDFSADLSVTDLLAIMFVRDNTDDVEILHGAHQHFNRLQQDSANLGNRGTPRRWIREGNSLILYARIPDSIVRTIKVTYLQRPDDLTADATLIPLNDEWLLPMELLASALTLNDLNSDKAPAKFQAVENILGTREDPEGIEDEGPEGLLIPASNTGLSSDGGEF